MALIEEPQHTVDVPADILRPSSMSREEALDYIHRMFNRHWGNPEYRDALRLARTAILNATIPLPRAASDVVWLKVPKQQYDVASATWKQVNSVLAKDMGRVGDDCLVNLEFIEQQTMSVLRSLNEVLLSVPNEEDVMPYEPLQSSDTDTQVFQPTKAEAADALDKLALKMWHDEPIRRALLLGIGALDREAKQDMRDEMARAQEDAVIEAERQRQQRRNEIRDGVGAPETDAECAERHNWNQPLIEELNRLHEEAARIIPVGVQSMKLNVRATNGTIISVTANVYPDQSVSFHLPTPVSFHLPTPLPLDQKTAQYVVDWMDRIVFFASGEGKS